MKGKKNVCILVSNRPWHRGLASRLARRTGLRFVSINRPRDLTLSRLARLAPRYVFFPHWSYRVDKSIYERFECVMFHMTDLPFGRGGSPLQNLIVRGFKMTKISALRCVEEMDAGPIYMKRPLRLSGSAQEIFLRASHIIEDMIVAITKSRHVPAPQKGTPTRFKRRTPDQSHLTGAKNAREVYDLIRMLDAEGYPHAFLEAGPFRLEFTKASRQNGHVTATARIVPIPLKTGPRR